MTDTPREEIEFHTVGEWTAVYLNRRLVRVGDSYLADEWLRSHLGVVDVDDDAFMLGQNSYEGVADTLDAVEDFRAERQARRDRAAELRAEARRLEDEAEALNGGHR